jgi:hypothetical protein
MSKMSRGLLEFIDRFALAESSRVQASQEAAGRNARRAAAGAQS